MDIYHDDGAHMMEKATEWGTFPPWVANTAILEKEAMESLPLSAFADIERRELPVVDRGHTFTSVVYFMDFPDTADPGRMQKVASRLVKACVKFEIQPPEPLVKIAQFGPETAPAPITKMAATPINLERAARVFAEKYTDHTPERRREIGLDLVKTAAEMGVEDLPETVALYGSHSWNPDLPGLLEEREFMAKQAGNDDAAEMYSQLSEHAFTCDPDEFAQTLHDIDKQASLEHFYDTRILDPYLVVFGAPFENEATEFKEAMQKFASSDEAAGCLSQSLLDDLTVDPLRTLDEVPDVTRNLIMMAYGEYAGGR